MLTIYPLRHIPFSLSTHLSHGRTLLQYAPIYGLWLWFTIWTTFNWIFYCSRVSSHPSTQQDARKKKKTKHQALRSCSALLQSQQAPCKDLLLTAKPCHQIQRFLYISLFCCFYSSCCWHQVVLTKCTIKKRDKLWKLVFLFCIPSWKQWNQPQK